MARRTKNISPIAVNVSTHEPIMLDAVRRYAAAAAHYEAKRSAGARVHLAHARFLEIAGELDQLLTVLVLRQEPQGFLVSPATDAALIKAPARNLADTIHEVWIDQLATRAHLAKTVHSILVARAATDARGCSATAPQDRIAA